MDFKISVIVPAYNAEDYLSETLDSLVNQTFKDFEVVIVNDGSTDKTQKIIDKYCLKYSNFRSVTQHNSGVSEARNKGINIATGDYLAFLDSDDLYTPQALEKLYEAAMENNAELVTGIAGHFNLFGSYVHKNTINLSNKKDIDPFEKRLIWSFSQCNKLFLRKKIIETGIRFPNLKYAEDGAFVLRFAYMCSKITGCPYEVAFYRKHDFWEGISATQKVDAELIKDYLKAHDLIYSDAAKILRKRVEQCKTAYEISEADKICQEYLNELLYRRATILFNEFYRLFWRADNASLNLINDIILSIKKDIFPETWLKLKNSFQDIYIDDLIYNRSLMAENPIVTIALNPGEIKEDELLLMLNSIYAQDFPSFELLIHESLSDKIPAEIMQKENIHLINSKGENFKNCALNESKGKYFLVIDNFIVLNPITLRTFFYNICNDNLDMVSSIIRRLNNYNISDYPSQELAYSYRNTVTDNRKSKFNDLDLYLSNKLVKIDFLKKVKFKFSDDSSLDTKRLYDTAKFRKLSENYILSNKNEINLLKSMESQNESVTYIKIIFISLLCNILYIFFRSRRVVKNSILPSLKGQFKSNCLLLFIKTVRRLPLKDRVFFCSIRDNDNLLENSRYVYNALSADKLYLSKMLPHSYKMQLRMIYYLLTSKLIVTDDYVGYFRILDLRDEQKVIQLWHACGAFKKFGLDDPFKDTKTEIETHSQYDSVMVSSEYIRKYYAGAFNLPLDKIKALGTPRTDMFFDEKNKKLMLDDLYEQHPQLKDKKIVLYCPTFREDNEGERIIFDTKINWANLNESLNDNELFVIRKHPVMEEDLLKGQKYSKIIDLSNVSTYKLMLVSSVMITDYSSVIFEYSLLNKPMIFYCPDVYTRDFYLKYPEDLPGVMIHNSSELIKEVRSVLTNPTIDNLKDFKLKYMSACDGNSTEKVVNLIKNYLSNNQSKISINDLDPAEKTGREFRSNSKSIERFNKTDNASITEELKEVDNQKISK